ncbi:MAG: hypothetical protein J6Q65_00975, partial [Lentisphaeria bacterium]|nr:hypothetical protein [Lentisphaeria bacterium]
GLEKLAAGLESGSFTATKDVEKLLRTTEAACNMGEFQLNQPLRVAATGTTVGADMYETVLILGAAETAKRIRTALEKNQPQA